MLKKLCKLATNERQVTYADHVLLDITPALEEGFDLVVGDRLLHAQLHEPLENEGVEIRGEDEKLLAVLDQDAVLVCPVKA